jgi:hypothetical protein
VTTAKLRTHSSVPSVQLSDLFMQCTRFSYQHTDRADHAAAAQTFRKISLNLRGILMTGRLAP